MPREPPHPPAAALMRPPAFWARDDGGLPGLLLAPLAVAAAAATARRVARPGWRAPVPVLCCGNAGVGGAGKTTLALDLGRRLLARGARPAFLTRGYGGRAAGAAIHVDPARDSARAVGDEALLLASVAPTVVSADRAAGARLAIQGGADVLVMDDGLQNPMLAKTLSLLVVDGAAGFGNGRVLPAGPLREPVAAAARRCAAAVLIGEDRANAAARLGAALPLLRATLRSDYDPAADDRPLVAFAGIGRPAKFFDSLEQRGARLLARHAFPDHHPYRAADLDAILDAAERAGARAVTTPKDAVRLPAALRARVGVVGVALLWDDPAAIEALLDRAMAR